MDLTREAIERIEEMSKPNIIEQNGMKFVDKDMTKLDIVPTASTIKCSTLDAICTYLKENVDNITYKVIVHVDSPTSVRVMSSVLDERKREIPIAAEAILPEFPFGKFIERTDFNIQMQSKFVQSGEDYASILAYVGTVEHGTVAQYGDDGVSQKATVSTGFNHKEECIVPNPVHLKPYRTFIEVDQPESLFVFRMNDEGREISAALFEADGKGWRNDAMKNIKTYLEENLVNLIQDGKVIVMA